jgi:hypothetical protein
MNRKASFVFKPARAAGLALVFAAMPMAASCRQILGIKERALKVESPDSGKGGGGNAATRCGKFDESSAECATCLDKKCCQAASDCADDPACKAAYQCVKECDPDDSDCATWCLGSYARPDSLAVLTACASSSCSEQCGVKCGGALPVGATTCDACVRSKCCDENAACAEDEACIEVESCNHRCLPAGSPNCSNLCTMQSETGANEYATRNACISAKCATECDTGSDWSCLDHPQPARKPLSLEAIEFHMTLVEFAQETPYEGVLVKACSRMDLPCDKVLASDTTKSDGSFDLTVPSGADGFDGYLDLSGPSIYPTIYYIQPAVTVGGYRGRLALPSATLITGLTTAIGAKLDPDRGLLALVPYDCTLSPAPGVTLDISTADESTTTYYFVNNAPSPAATQTDAAPAIGGAVNLPAQLALVTATANSVGKKSAQLNFNIRAGTLTAGSIPPTP